MEKAGSGLSTFILKRLLTIPLSLLVVSIVCFAVIYVTPGDFVSNTLDDGRTTLETLNRTRAQLGIDQPPHLQYLNWVWGVLSRWDFGETFESRRPVTGIIGDRIAWTVVVSSLTLIFAWCVAIPLGIAAALRKGTWFDYAVSVIGYTGLAVPDFLVALLAISIVLNLGGTNISGLFSPEYIDAPWSWAKLWNMIQHLWLPLLVIGTSGIAGLMRLMRANLLDVLGHDYVRTARAKGLAGRVVVYRHALRNAINPLITIAGLSLDDIVTGTIIGSIILRLPTIGPVLYDALLKKDQWLAMTMLVFSALMLMIGNLLADIALALSDPRIRYD